LRNAIFTFFAIFIFLTITAAIADVAKPEGLGTTTAVKSVREQSAGGVVLRTGYRPGK